MSGGGGSLDGCCARASSMAEALSAEIAELQAAGIAGTQQQHASAANRLAALRGQVKQVQALAQKEIVAEKRQLAKERASKLNSELASLQQAYDRLRAAHSPGASSPSVASRSLHAHERERDELFRRANGELATAGLDTSIPMMERMAAERDVLSRANSQVDDYLQVGANVLMNLQNQRSTLKGAQRKLLDAANTIGLSQHVIRIIERRSRQDMWILRAGIFVTLVVMYLAWRYLL